MKKIKNILFDLGGIFIELDYLKTENAFISLGVTNFSELYNQHLATPLFLDLETGRIEEEEFYNAFRKTALVNLSNKQIKDAWNAMLLNFPPERLDWLKHISKKYKTYLFSNTNIIHYTAVQKIFYENTAQKNLDDFFVKAYYSHTLKMRKPDPASFSEILRIENLVADETLFVDDTPKNIEGAKQAGLQTMLLQPPKTVFDIEV
jgi:putative hydrolase of the HAD superfamily